MSWIWNWIFVIIYYIFDIVMFKAFVCILKYVILENYGIFK